MKLTGKHSLRIFVWVYCALWAMTAIFGLSDVDRQFNQEFATGTKSLNSEEQKADVLPVVRIPFSTVLRGSSSMSSYVPEQPWRSRTNGIAIAPFLVIDEVACQWTPLAGISAHRIVFWFFGHTQWNCLYVYWVS